MNYEVPAIVDSPEYPLDMPPKPSDSDRSDECGTNEACIMHEPEEEGSIDVSTLLGPSSVPAPLYDAVPKDEQGRPSWERLHALVVAVEALVSARCESREPASSSLPLRIRSMTC